MVSRRPPSDDFGDDGPTVIDEASPLTASGDYDTPVDVPHCNECGAVVVLDTYTDVSLHAFPSHCLRAKNGLWWWCAKFRKSVTYVPE